MGSEHPVAEHSQGATQKTRGSQKESRGMNIYDFVIEL